MLFELILTIINTILCLYLIILKIKETFLIVKVEEWNKVVTVFNDAVLAGYVDDDNNFTTECQNEAAGGYGFFRDIIYEEE